MSTIIIDMSKKYKYKWIITLGLSSKTFSYSDSTEVMNRRYKGEHIVYKIVKYPQNNGKRSVEYFRNSKLITEDRYLIYVLGLKNKARKMVRIIFVRIMFLDWTYEAVIIIFLYSSSEPLKNNFPMMSYISESFQFRF